MPTLKGLPEALRGVRYPDVRFNATIYRHDGTQVRTDAGGKEADNTGRATNDIVAATVQKFIGNPIGTWSLQLVPRAEYFNLTPAMKKSLSGQSSILLPGDWCFIESTNGSPDGMLPLMYGPITDIRRRRITNDKGAVITTVSVSGADFGKALARISAIEDITLAKETVLQSAELAAAASGLDSTTGTPGDILQVILSRYLFDLGGQVIDPKTKRTFGAQDLDLGYITTAVTSGQALLSPINLAGTLWQALEQWSNPSLNEMFCDLRPSFGNQSDFKNLKPAIVLRQYPFDADPWNALTAVKVDRTEVINDDMGRSDADVRNWIRPMDEPQLRQTPGIAAVTDHVGVFVPGSIKRFGFSRYESPTAFCYDNGKPIADLIQKHALRQAAWHHSNELLISATMELYHRPDIRIGYRLDYSDKETGEELQFYVEGVQHSYNYPGRSTTMLTLTRGRASDDKIFSSSVDSLQANGYIKTLGNTGDRIAEVFK